MPVSQFPTRYNPDYPDDPVSLTHLILVDHPPEWPAASIKTFKDGGATYSLQNTNYVLRWELSYDALTREDAEVLDNHYLEAQSIFGSFSFRHPRRGVLFTNVHYESFEYPAHEHVDCQSRHIVLIKRPPQNDPGFLLLESGDNLLLESGGNVLRQN